MIEYPKAYVIPFEGGGQRSDAEANRLVQWLLDNGIDVSRAKDDFRWNGTKYPRGSYVVWMDQALRGLALTTLSPGQDISDRISVLYAPPGAWSHGLVWGADASRSRAATGASGRARRNPPAFRSRRRDPWKQVDPREVVCRDGSRPHRGSRPLTCFGAGSTPSSLKRRSAWPRRDAAGREPHLSGRPRDGLRTRPGR